MKPRAAQTCGLAMMALMMAACASIAPPQPPSLDLPKPPTDLRASRKGDRVILTWTIPSVTTDRETARNLGPTRICRTPGDLTACGAPAGETTTQPVSGGTKSSTPKAQGTYTDGLPAQAERDDPSASMTYGIEVFNHEGRTAGLSNRVKVPLARTLPPPRDFRASVAKPGVILSWAGDAIPQVPAEVQYIYRIYRRPEGSNEQALAGETPATSQSEFTLTDANIEWQKTYSYHAETVTQIRRAGHSPVDVEGDDTAEIKVFADDVFPPAVPSELQAVFSGPGQKAFIDLVWAPVMDADLAGYNVYRREEGTTLVKLNSELIKAPAYRDTDVVSHKRYFYSVSAVDARGNESARSEEASEAVPSGEQ